MAARAALLTAAARRVFSLIGPIPANQSSPSASNGAMPAMLTASVTRSDSFAAHASACGPPPEWPITANRSTPSASATTATSAATPPIVRPGSAVEPP
jgi:hypothetical protein